MAKVIQPAFARGEIAPALYGRVDTAMYFLALRTARNAVVHSYGGVSNRPGTTFIGPVALHVGGPPRLIPFQFKTTDTHIIEMGHHYIRIIRNDAHVIEDQIDVTGATQANPVEITTGGAHGFSTNEEVFLTGIGGMTDISEERFLITVTGANTFTLRDQVDGTAIDGTGFPAYTSGGAAARILTMDTPYQQSELRDIKFTQSADVMTLVHPNHPPKELRRLAVDDWELVDVLFRPQHQPPQGTLAVTVSLTGGTTMAYKITAINSDTDEESLPALNTAFTRTITNITQANPAVVTTSAAHGLTDGDEIEITDVVGMTEVNNRRFRVNNLTSTTFELRDIDSTNFTAYDSAGTVTAAFVRVTNSRASGNEISNTVTWPLADQSKTYLVYRSEANGRYSFIGETEASSFRDTDAITPNQQEGPPVENNPFFGPDNQPRAVGAFEQRRIFGGSDNEPDTSHFSRIGAFNNFSSSFPMRADDAIKATLPASQVNEIRHYVTLNDLLVFTSGAEWRVGSGDNVGFAFDTMRQKKQTNWGASNIPPVIVGNTVLFVQEANSMVRSIGFSFDIDGYSSNNLSLLVPHLLVGHQIVEWSLGRFPDPFLYMIREDGQAIVLTFEEEQQVIAWTHWDTVGRFESVATIRPSFDETDDLAYFVVSRNINGRRVRYIERTVPRRFEDVRDAFFVDSGLTHDIPFEIENISSADPLVVTITDHPFINGDQVDIFDVSWQPAFDESFTLVSPQHLNGGRFEVAETTANTFQLKSIETGETIDGSEFEAYIGGGTVRLAVQFLSGLKHLANTPVVALADGNVVSGLTVNGNGTVELPRRFSRIHIGLRIVSDVETLDIEGPSATIQGMMKKINKVMVRMDKSRGLLIGPSEDLLIEWKQREFEAWGEPTDLLTGDAEIHIEPDWNTNGRLFIRQKDPLPMTILAVVPELELEDAEDG